jgi:hypothetical protein
VVITINGTNDAPVISVESGDSAAESLMEANATLSTGGTLTVTDLDLSDAVTSAVTSVVASGTTNGLQSNNAALIGHVDVHAECLGQHGTDGSIDLGV